MENENKILMTSTMDGIKRFLLSEIFGWLKKKIHMYSSVTGIKYFILEPGV